MTEKEILATAIIFHPNIKDPCVITIGKDEIPNALDRHYKIINPLVDERYEERGYLLTISGRIIRNITGDKYQALVDESSLDIQMALRSLICGRMPRFTFLICEYHNVHHIMNEVQLIIDSFKFRFDYKIKMEVIHETNIAEY